MNLLNVQKNKKCGFTLAELLIVVAIVGILVAISIQMCIRDSYYTDQCPFTYYWVPKVLEAAKEHGISFQAFHITDKEAAQNVPAPVTTYAPVSVSYTHLHGSAPDCKPRLAARKGITEKKSETV